MALSKEVLKWDGLKTRFRVASIRARIRAGGLISQTPTGLMTVSTDEVATLMLRAMQSKPKGMPTDTSEEQGTTNPKHLTGENL